MCPSVQGQWGREVCVGKVVCVLVLGEWQATKLHTSVSVARSPYSALSAGVGTPSYKHFSFLRSLRQLCLLGLFNSVLDLIIESPMIVENYIRWQCSVPTAALSAECGDLASDMEVCSYLACHSPGTKTHTTLPSHTSSLPHCPWTGGHIHFFFHFNLFCASITIRVECIVEVD